MKMKAIANYVKKQPDIQKVYLLNQDYAHGKQWAHYGREMVGLTRPDVQFVGETLHPIGRVKISHLSGQDQEQRGRLRHHRQLGPGHSAAAQGGG